MSLIGFVVVLIILGLIIWLVDTYIPIPPPFKVVIHVILVIIIIVWLLQLLGITGPMLPRLR